MDAVQTLETRLRDLLEPVLIGLGYEMVAVEWASGGKSPLLRLYIDQADGITVDDCARASRAVSALLDVEDPVPDEYRLEVSSPGLDRPLVTPAHYQRFVGSLVAVKLLMPQDGRSNFKGRIAGCDGQVVNVDVDGQPVALSLAAVERARLVPEI